jgi:Domain of unknown function (DUF4124)
MKYSLLAALFLTFPASAELYRWIDRESGSVKFSSTPPPWFGDPERERAAPAVEVIPSRGSGAPPKPAAPDAAPARASLEAGWRKALQQMTAIAERPEPQRNMAQLQEALGAAEAFRVELNRIDPGGAAARERETQGVMERIRRGLQAAR